MKTILLAAACASALSLTALASPPTEGLLLYYSFDRNDGATVRDDSPGNRTGEVDGATWIAQGARGGAYRFDSNEQRILADDAGLPQGDEPRTLSVWIKLNVLYPEQTTGLLTYGTHRYNRMSGVGMDWRNGRDQYYFTQHGGVALSRQKMESPGVWHHLAYTYAGNGQHHFFVDGKPTDGMSELQGPIDTLLSGALIIGGHPGSVGPNGGFLDEVRIYGRALPPEEIQALAADRDPETTGSMDTLATPNPAQPPTPETAAPAGDLHAQALRLEPELQQIGKEVTAEKETMVLQWTSVPGRSYEVQWTDDLSRPFTVIASNLLASGTEQSYTHEMGGARSAFYRVKIQD